MWMNLNLRNCCYLNAAGCQNAAPPLSCFEETVNAYLQFYTGDYIRDHGGMNRMIVSAKRQSSIT